MRAITVKQPWAWAIIHGGKDVENRAQTWSYRGLLAVHAGAAWAYEGGTDDRVRSACRQYGREHCAPHDHPITADMRGSLYTPDGSSGTLWNDRHFPTGVIIGVANLTDVHRATQGCCTSEWADAEYNGKPGTHLVLADVYALREPVPAKGLLGLWQMPPRIEAAVCEQMPDSCSVRGRVVMGRVSVPGGRLA